MTVLRTICPCCGTDIALDSPIMINDFSMNGAGHPLLYQGRPVPLSHDQALVCWALMKAYPSDMSTMALGERLGSEADDCDNLIKVHISRIRHILRERAMPQPIYTLHGHHSYVWEPRAEPEA